MNCFRSVDCSRHEKKTRNEKRVSLKILLFGLRSCRRRGVYQRGQTNKKKELNDTEVFKSQARAQSKMFAIWWQCGFMVSTFFQFFKAERTWKLALAYSISALATTKQYFFLLDRPVTPTMATSLPCWYMKQTESQHSKVHQELVAENHSSWHIPGVIYVTDSKSKGGTVGISQSPRSLERRFLTIHRRAS